MKNVILSLIAAIAVTLSFNTSAQGTPIVPVEEAPVVPTEEVLVEEEEDTYKGSSSSKYDMYVFKNNI